jgi:flagellar biosynthesis/type III secretory pathway M-ring protein FliF/YscJ
MHEMDLREKLKQEVDSLNEDQLKQVESFIDQLHHRFEESQKRLQYLASTTPEERAREFQEWLAQFPRTGVTLPDEAFDRESIYSEDGC